MNKGFTLFEIIIYIALFSILLGGVFLTAFQLINDSSELSAKNTIINEGNFVIRKMNYALTGMKDFSIDSNALIINRYDNLSVTIKLGQGAEANKILMDDSGHFLPITTDNVQVVSLQFTQIENNSKGITVNIKIKNSNSEIIDFEITKYVQ